LQSGKRGIPVNRTNGVDPVLSTACGRCPASKLLNFSYDMIAATRSGQ
jgi:hypothetical protein